MTEIEKRRRLLPNLPNLHPSCSPDVGATRHVEPFQEDQTTSGADHRVQKGPHRPQVQPRYERSSEARVHQTHRHRTRRGLGHGLGEEVSRWVGDIDRLPQVDAEVEVELHRLVLEVVVPVQEGCSDKILEPRRRGLERVAVASSHREASHSLVPSSESARHVRRPHLVVYAGVDELVVGDVGYARDCVDIGSVLRDPAVDVDETCTAKSTQRKKKKITCHSLPTPNLTYNLPLGREL